MSQVTGIGTSWNLPNYAGELFTADAVQTPLLAMTGGLTGGKQTLDSEFPIAVLYDYPDAVQPDISESGSVTAPAATAAARSVETNVVQIFQEAIDITYVKQSNLDKLRDLAFANEGESIDEKSWQIQQKLIKIARDVEHSFFNGEYQKATGADVANKTRGLFELCEGGTTIDAGGEALSKEMLKELFRNMADNGAYFNNMVLFCNSYQKQMLSELFANQFVCGGERNVGGVNVSEIETDFFKMGVVWNRFVPADKIIIADVAHISPVFQAVPGKGILFEEELAKTGASDRIQLFGQIGLAHGPAFLHGSITGLESA